RVYAALLDGAEALTYAVPEGHRAYVHVARGSVQVNGQQLDAGDGAKIAAEAQLHFGNGRQAELLLFDMA
ncbi:MAG TPA: pirin family protein, partial [Burkholderiales bacterium]|nr:pirin family protein [Burkholderiales bacterium]